MTQIHPSAVVHKNAQIADSVEIGPFCVVEENARIGEGTILHSHVVVAKDAVIGKGNMLYPFSTIGKAPQILGLKPDTVFGNLVIGDNNTIRENVTIHPGMHEGGLTKVGSNNLVMIGSHIGHDCIIEDNIIMSNGCQISGHCHVKQGVWMSGMSGLHQFVTIGRWAYIAGLSAITHDVPPFLIISGHYPPTIRSVNKRGLNRAGMTEDQKSMVLDAFKKLYRTGGTLLETAKEIAAQPNLDPNVAEIVETIINSSKHRFGRYLETFR